LSINDIVTSRVGNALKVEVIAQANTTTTLPNYGLVGAAVPGAGYAWSITSGQNGHTETEEQAVEAAAKAIREHWKRHGKKAGPGRTVEAPVVPTPVIEAVAKLMQHFGPDNVIPFYSHTGEAVVMYRQDERAGRGFAYLTSSGNGDEWIMAVHTDPALLQPGLPGRFNAHVMYDTRVDWYPTES
jgi:hypothetical protein